MDNRLYTQRKVQSKIKNSLDTVMVFHNQSNKLHLWPLLISVNIEYESPFFVHTGFTVVTGCLLSEIPFKTGDTEGNARVTQIIYKSSER